jgi:hexosaminidase
MSYSKLNVFHWHIVDTQVPDPCTALHPTQSFPLVMPSLPGFSAWGAYSSDQVYSPNQVTLFHNLLQQLLTSCRCARW